jgi:hypothetical protein
MCLQVEGAGKSNTIIKYTGTGTYGIKVMYTTTLFYGQVIGGFSLHGNAGATHGMVVDGVGSCRYHDIQIQDFPMICFIGGFVLVTYFDNIFCAPATTIHPQTVQPQRGFAWGWDALGHNMTSSWVIGCWAEGASVAGLRINTVLDCTFIGGTSENNGAGGIGLEIIGETQMCTFIGMDLEGNPGGDIVITGGNVRCNTFINMLSVGTVLHNSGLLNRFQGGIYNTFTIGAPDSLVIVDGIYYGSGGGAFTDNTPNNTIYLSPLMGGVSPVAEVHPLRASKIISDFGATAPFITWGTGSPEGVVTAPISSLYLRKTLGGTGTTLYVKESGSGNVGWIGK